MGSWMDDNSGKSLNLPACVPGHHTPSCLHPESGHPVLDQRDPAVKVLQVSGVHPVSGAEDVDGMAGFRKRHRVFNLALKLLF